MAGFETTLPITLEHMINHVQGGLRAVRQAFVLVNLPFGTYQGNPGEALNSAVRIMKEKRNAWRQIGECSSPVSAFIDAIFQQLEEKKQELTFGFSELMSKASPDMIAETFAKMNPLCTLMSRLYFLPTAGNWDIRRLVQP